MTQSAGTIAARRGDVLGGPVATVVAHGTGDPIGATSSTYERAGDIQAGRSHSKSPRRRNSNGAAR
jgi:hypothetical protein